MVGVLTRICGRVKTRVETCRAARSGRGNILALSCAENLLYWRRKIRNWEEGLTSEKGAELKNAKGRMRAKDVMAETTRRVLKDW